MTDMFLGPLTFVFDVAPESKISGIVMTVVLVPCLAAWPLKRRPWAAVVTGLAVAAWLFLGLIGGATDA